MTSRFITEENLGALFVFTVFAILFVICVRALLRGSLHIGDEVSSRLVTKESEPATFYGFIIFGMIFCGIPLIIIAVDLIKKFADFKK